MAENLAAAVAQTPPTGELRPPLFVVEPRRGWVPLNLRELWKYRELLFFLCWRDVKVRYQQTILGVAWAILQPFFTMVVFSIFFGYLAKMPSEGVPYPIFAFAALVPWGLFATGLSRASDSLVGSASLIQKVYFPRLIVPLSGLLSGVVDFLFSFGILLGLMAWYGISPTVNVVWLPAFLLLALLAALGVGLWLSALNVQFRDVRYTLGFLTQLWMFLTPIAYPSSLIQSEHWRLAYGLNPMTGVVDGFRWALLNTNAAPGAMTAVSAAMSVALLVSGAFYFRRMEKTFADVV
jgi:lipopolysaccharide transport system permease protein